MPYPPRPDLPAESNKPVASGSLILAEDGAILMRRSLEDYAPSAHAHVIESAKALERFRTGAGSEALDSAETSADRAIATFGVHTGEPNAPGWWTAVLYMVELRATRYSCRRATVFDPLPRAPSLFTPGSPMRLESISREAHEHILSAGASRERERRGGDAMDIARAQDAIHEAARLLADELPGLSMPLWTLISRYCAEIQAQNLAESGQADAV